MATHSKKRQTPLKSKPIWLVRDAYTDSVLVFSGRKPARYGLEWRNSPRRDRGYSYWHFCPATFARATGLRLSVGVPVRYVLTRVKEPRS
jgi:hypothetical protein